MKRKKKKKRGTTKIEERKGRKKMVPGRGKAPVARLRVERETFDVYVWVVY